MTPGLSFRIKWAGYQIIWILLSDRHIFQQMWYAIASCGTHRWVVKSNQDLIYIKPDEECCRRLDCFGTDPFAIYSRIASVYFGIIQLYQKTCTDFLPCKQGLSHCNGSWKYEAFHSMHYKAIWENAILCTQTICLFLWHHWKGTNANSQDQTHSHPAFLKFHCLEAITVPRPLVELARSDSSPACIGENNGQFVTFCNIFVVQ